MEKPQGTSFIPKSPVQGTVKPQGVRKVYILTYVTYVLFFGTLLATGGIFVYGLTVNTQLVSEKNNLAEERKSFEEADLERIRRLDARMDAAFSVLDRHVSVRSIFKALETSTIRPVQIEGFEYNKDTDNSLNFTFNIRTGNFNNALFQREIFSSDSILAGATVSELDFSAAEPGEGLFVQDPDTVHFTVSKVLSVDDIPYVANIFDSEESVFNSSESSDPFSGLDSLLNSSSTVLLEPEVVDVINE